MREITQFKDFIYSSDLFRPPSVLKGVARSIDMFAGLTEYKFSQSEKEADCHALQRDWIVVGKDINKAIKKYGQEVAPIKEKSYSSR